MPASTTPARTSSNLSVVFDLDGTLTDSKPGILNCLSKALAACNVVWDGPLDWFIGPPVEQSFTRLMPDRGEAARDEMVRHYRTCYEKTGWAENSVYSGIPELLVSLKARGADLYVCTSKRENFALRILAEFGLAEHFIAIYADRGEMPHSKVELLATLVREQGLDPANSFMVGDRSFDLEAAHANGLAAIAVSYGYGSPEELNEGKPLAVCATPDEVLQTVFASVVA